MKVDIVRERALHVLNHVIEKNGYANLSLDSALEGLTLARDRAFVSEIVYGTLRHLKTLDAVIAHFSNIKLRKISGVVRNILRMSSYQMVYMRVPHFACINESVRLTKKYSHAGSVAFVNALLRKVSQRHEEVVFKDDETLYSFPQWMIEKWYAQKGVEFTRALMESLNQRPELCFRVNTLKIAKDILIKQLQEEGVTLKPGRYIEEAFLVEGAELFSSQALKQGLLYVQDESSMVAVKVLDPKKGERVLDMCAAPGGKSSYCASLMQNQGEIEAWDIHPHRVDLLKKNFERLGVGIAKARKEDALVLKPHLVEGFDKVIVDAPCSGLGVIRKKPEIKWDKSEDDIQNLQKIQKQLLNTAANYVKPGGVLVYSTCTLLQEENEEVVNTFLQNHPSFNAQVLQPFLPEPLKNEVSSHCLTLYPHKQGGDGFFIARMKRNETK